MASDEAEPRRPSHQAELQDFIRWIDKNSVNGLNAKGEPTPFMPQPKLKEYLRQGTRMQSLIGQVFEPHAPPVHAATHTILENCTAIFAILVRIGYGKFIGEFSRRKELFDDRLPYLAKPANFPISDNSFFQKFEKEQWRFCVHNFSKEDTDIQIEDRCILPIISQTKIAEGGTADIFKIVIHNYYDALDPLANVPGDPASIRKYDNTYVLKTFHSKKYAAQTLYNAEIAAFRHLRESSAHEKYFIGYYGSFVHENKYNILLEYADMGSLRHYFDKVHPPSTGGDIIKLWQGLFGVLHAVESIHTIKVDDSQEGPVFKGWHQDIKPENILVCSDPSTSPYDVHFRLADLGLSHFRREKARCEQAQKQGQSTLEDVRDKDAGGTREYGAPECYRRSASLYPPTRAIGQSVDIWSLGCVYSEAAQWIVHGPDGLEQYRQRRLDSTKAIRGHMDPGCFHDTVKVLKCVKSVHDELFRNKRESDFMMRPVLKKMVEEMLYENVGRPTATLLLYKVGGIVDAAKMELEKHRKEPLSRSPTIRSLELGTGTMMVRRLSKDSRSSTMPPSTGDVPPLEKFDTVVEATSVPSTQEFAKTSRINSTISSQSNGKHAEASASDHENPEPGLESSIEEGTDQTTGEECRRLSSHSKALSPFVSPASTNSNGKKRLPDLSISQALFYIIWHKTRLGLISMECMRYLDDLGKRDHVFLIDDAASMAPHWQDVQILTYIFTSLLKTYDEDGMDVYFSSSEVPLNSRKVTPLMHSLFGHPTRNTSNIGSRLDSLVTDYIDKMNGRSHRTGFFSRKQTLKPLNVYVLTNGIWEPKSDAESPIRRLVNALEQHGRVNRQVGIQFIFFGNDEAARQKLQRLDSELGLERDVVDMTPATGNVLKMLVGAINKEFDDDEERSNGQAGASSSPSPQPHVRWPTHPAGLGMRQFEDTLHPRE